MMAAAFYSVREVMELLGISRAHAYKLVKNGQIETIRLGRKVLIPAWWVKTLTEDPNK